MIRRMAVVAALAFALPGHAGELREWTDRKGTKFSASIVANDAFRVTLEVPERGGIVVPLAQLSDGDADFIAAWRKRNRAAPLVDPARIAPWPGEVAVADFSVRQTMDDETARVFVYEGARFLIRSDVRLPLEVVRDLNAVFESTRMALMSLPIGLHPGGEDGRYQVFLFSTAEGYGQAGGPPGSGGYYEGRSDTMLIMLPNLGINVSGGKRIFDYQRNLFILKHEVTHQLLRHWRGALPTWLNEGLAEVMAAAPYVRGRYNFTAMDAAIGTYVQKWRKAGEARPLVIATPAALLGIDQDSWQSHVNGQTAYDLYNSAALFTWFLLRHDAPGDGRGIAAFLDAVRRGGDPGDAVSAHILRGRGNARLLADFSEFLRKRGLRYQFAAEVAPR